MPLIKSAIKALRQDRSRALINRKYRSLVKTLTDTFKANPTAENLSQAYQALDRAAKKHIIHSNKAARLKAQLAKKLISSKSVASKPAATAKKTKPQTKKTKKSTPKSASKKTKKSK